MFPFPGMNLRSMAPVMMLAMHFVFGAVLGGVNGMLLHRSIMKAT